MTKKHFIRLAEIISHIQDTADRARVAQQVGLLCVDVHHGMGFNWSRWNAACKAEG